MAVVCFHAWCLRPRPLGVVLAVALLTVSCDLAYPEVVVVNRTDEKILLRNLSFSGCLWDEVLAYGETTSPGRCLPGEDRVHFQKLVLHDMEDQGGLSVDDDEVSEEPIWFNYQSVAIRKVDYGEVHIFEITAEAMEQDFSIPGPYGH